MKEPRTALLVSLLLVLGIGGCGFFTITDTKVTVSQDQEPAPTGQPLYEVKTLRDIAKVSHKLQKNYRGHVLCISKFTPAIGTRYIRGQLVRAETNGSIVLETPNKKQIRTNLVGGEEIWVEF